RHALPVYREIEHEFTLRLLEQVKLKQFFRTVDERAQFFDKIETEPFLSLDDTNDDKTFLNYHFGSGAINPCYIINTAELLRVLRGRLKASGQLIEENCGWDEISISAEGVQYKEIKANKLICCEGAA